MDLKFCCERLKYRYSAEKSMGLNIRVVKLSDAFVERGKLVKNKNVWITEGYLSTIADCKKTVSINYCPFCGEDLEYMLSSDNYVQEVQGF